MAQNLLDIMQKDAIIKAETRTFVTNWIRTGPKEKRKAFFDVWETVLREYLPDTRPVLFRTSDRIGKKAKYQVLLDDWNVQEDLMTRITI
ncbi:hypothetical protein [Flavobacterium sp. CSZ]|uniref:hypothetical protein n=1 Tax=Flavobacterium sp. CSZ TaxID=2783791 RepID=UPI001E3FC9C9|nr:hypothetical protein [Flavobacterium sp. CSZ]